MRNNKVKESKDKVEYLISSGRGKNNNVDFPNLLN